MLAVTFYCIPALFINGGPGIWILYLCFAIMNTILRLTNAVSDFDIGTCRRICVRMCVMLFLLTVLVENLHLLTRIVRLSSVSSILDTPPYRTNKDLFIANQTSFFSAIALVLFAMVKYRISSGKKSLPSIQAEAIKAASDNDDTADDDTASKKWESDLGKVGNPVQKLFRRHSSLTMKHCPYTHGSHVIYECPSCLAKVSDSAWHQSDVCARTGGGAFFTLRERLATLMDITEDVDEVRVYLRIHMHAHACTI